MTITKYGHCCLLIEVAGKRILTDPGRFSTAQNELTNIDLILITHEHSDHFHTESVHAILANNPNAKIITNTSVGKLLAELGVTYEVVEGRDSAESNGVSIEAFDGEHVEIVKDYGLVQNTGYFINNELFYPGDAYTEPGKPVRVLALPIAGPWCKVSDAISYALAVAPEHAFPVHDATLSEVGRAVTVPHFTRELAKANTTFTDLTENETTIL